LGRDQSPARFRSSLTEKGARRSKRLAEQSFSLLISGCGDRRGLGRFRQLNVDVHVLFATEIKGPRRKQKDSSNRNKYDQNSGNHACSHATCIIGHNKPPFWGYE
jgi:hypothetical protein